MTGNGKLFIILGICISCVCAEADPKDGPIRPTPTNIYNSISLSTVKPEILSYQQLSHLGKNLPQQIYQTEIRSPMQYRDASGSYQELLRSQTVPSSRSQVPVAMVIIAQPAYVPASALHPGNIGQLLQFFRGNSNARYQLLHGNYAQQQPLVVQSNVAPTQRYYQYQLPIQYQPTNQYQPSAQSSVHYQNQEQPQGRAIYHQPEQQQITAQGVNALQQQSSLSVFGQKLYPAMPYQTQHVSYEAQQQNSLEQTQTETPFHQQNHISHIAQQAAEKFLMGNNRHSSSQGAPQQQYKTAPAIFTGFENFSPEQQAKIKAQLSAHFGAPLQAIKVGSHQKNTGGSSDSRESSGEKMS